MYYTSAPTAYIVIFITILMGDEKNAIYLHLNCFIIWAVFFSSLTLTQQHGKELSAVYLVFHSHTFMTRLNIHTQTHKSCFIRV